MSLFFIEKLGINSFNLTNLIGKLVNRSIGQLTNWR